MDVKLTIYDDKRQFFSQVVALPCVVGRSKQSNIAIVHPLISRQHCELYEDGGFVKARDLGSLNGTFYRGERIGRGVVIPLGDAFSIGALYFLVEAAGPETTKLVVSSPDDVSDVMRLNGVPTVDRAPTSRAPIVPSTPSDVLLTSDPSNDDVYRRLVAAQANAASAENDLVPLDAPIDETNNDDEALDLAQYLDPSNDDSAT